MVCRWTRTYPDTRFMDKNMRVSVVIPIYPMENHTQFLWDCLQSVMEQTYTDYEIVITQQGSMTENTNAGIKRATGDLIKILYMDDKFAHKDALKEMVELFDGNWLIAGAQNNPEPRWTDNIELGNNKLGSPSALMIRNDNPLLFDEEMVWALDCDYYKRLYERYGPPNILNGVHIDIGVHDGQASALLTEEEKAVDIRYLKNKYDTSL